MAELGLLGSKCSPGTQEIKVSAWGKVDVDRTEKVRGSGEKTSSDLKIRQTGGSDPATAPLLYVGGYNH